MALKKWSQAEVVFSTTSTTKICLIDGADPENKLISVQDLLNYITSGYVLTKEAVEAVLTGNITSHTHSQYLTAITKQMVESVLTGTITSHNHNVSNIIGAVSQTDLSIHAADSTHLTLEQLTFLNNLMITGGLTSEQVEILDLLSTDVDNNLIVSTNLIVEGSITAYSIGDPSIINYDMLNNWIDYSPTMTNWVISAPLIYELYTNLNSTISALDLKVDVVRQILPGLGLSGGGTLDNDVTLSLNIENLSLNSIIEDDYIAFYRTDGNHYKGLVSDLPFINSLLQIYTPTYSNPNSISGGGLQGGGLLTNNLYLELDLNSLDTYSGLIEEALDYLVVYDNSTSLHKKLSISNLPKKAEWGNITGLITDQLDLISLITNNDLNSRRVIGGDGIYITNNGYLDQDITVTLDISKLDTQSILSTDYLPFWRTGNDQFRGTASDLASLLSAYQGWYFRSENNVGNQIGTYQITESSSATIKEGTNITITQVDGIITINAATTGTTYSAGTGLLLNSTTFNHLNSVTPQTIQGIYPITIDAEGHISTYGTAVTSLKNPNSIILKFDTGITENTNLYTYDGSSAKVIDIKSGNGILLTKSSNSITVNHADTSSITNVTSSENTFISAISFDTYGHVTARSTESINFNVSSNYAFSNMMISSDSGYTWGIANTNTTQSSESSSDTLILVNGNKINLYTNTISGVDAIKLEHQFTTRTNTTSVLSPSSGDSFTVIDSLVSDSTGHITTVNTKTVTLPIIAAISSVSSVSADQLIVYNGTTTPQLAIVTASVANGSLALATGGQIYSFVTGLGYTSNVGTVTSVSSLNSNHLVVTNSTTAPLLEIITDAIINGGTALATGDQIYDFVINLGYTSNVGTLTQINTTGAISGGPITTTGTISHLTTTGYKHIPSGGLLGQILLWSDDGTAAWYTPTWTSNTGTVTNVSSSTINQLIVLNGGTTPEIGVVTSAIINGGTSLATGDQIYDFVLGLGYTTNLGTVTNVSSTTPNQLLVINGNTAPEIGVVVDDIIELGTSLATGAQIYSFVTGLGYTSTTGTVTNVSSTTPNQLIVLNGTTTPQIGIVTNTIISEGTSLATSGQIYDFVVGLGYTSNVGTVTNVTSSTPNQLIIFNGSTTPQIGIFTDVITNIGVALATGAQIYDFVTGLGYTSNAGTVTSVGITVPTGLSVSGSPITTSGSFNITFSTGYSIPTTASQTNWNTAYSWGNHALAGYLTEFIETDPVFISSPAYAITLSNILNWDDAYSWGDHNGLYSPASHTLGYHLNVAIGVDSPEAAGDLLRWDGIFWDNWTPTYENGLGNPTVSGYLLSSTSLGVRSWIAPYSHPAYTQKSITAIGGQVISTFTSDATGHVTGITLRTLVESDIPALSISKITGLSSALDGKVETSIIGQPGGIAPLDSNAKLDSSYLPDSILGQLIYVGNWDALTNTPILPDATTVKGNYYIVTVEGTYGGVNFTVGDWVLSDGVSWTKVDNSDAVTSVFGRIGNVVANGGDYSTYYVRYDTIQSLNSTQQTQARTNIDAAKTSHTHLWSNITDPPATYAPSSHTLGFHSNVSIGVDSEQVTGQLIRWSGTEWNKWTPDYMTTSHVANSITSTDIANWNTTYTSIISSITTTGNSGAATLISNVLNIPNYTLSGLGGEPSILAGSTSQYWRGDKSWQTLNTTAVTEGTRLYFTTARAIASPLTGYVATSGTITITDTILTAIQKLGFDKHSHSNISILNSTTASFTVDLETKLNGIAEGATANVGTVTSVAVTPGLGISVTGSTITNSGTFIITNTAPNVSTNLSFSGVSSPYTLNSSDGTDVTFTAGTGIGLSITSGNMTITNSSPDQVVTLIEGTGISISGTYPSFTISNSAEHVVTDLSQGTRTDISVSILSSTGADATLDIATATLAGVMSAADKSKLDGISAGATANTGTVTTVNSGNGMDFTSFTTSGTIVLGTPSNLVKSSINNVTANSHTHLVDLSTWNLEDLGNVVDLPGVNQYLYYNGTSWLTSSLDSYTQTLSLSSDILSISGGNSVSLISYTNLPSYWTVNSGCLITSGTNYSVTLGSQTAYTTAKLYVQGADTAEGLLVRAALLDYRAFGVNNYDDVSLFDVTGDGKIYMHNITEASTSQVLYYDTTTKLVTYGLSQPLDIPALPPQTVYGPGGTDTLAIYDVSTATHRKIALYQLKDYFTSVGLLTEAPEDGNIYGRKDGTWVTVSGGTTNHAALTNLDYAVSGHTGFVSTATAQTISGIKTFSSNPIVTSSYDAYVSVKSTNASSYYNGLIIYDNASAYKFQVGYDNYSNVAYLYTTDFINIAVGSFSNQPIESTIARFTTQSLWLKDIAVTPTTPSTGFGGFYVKADKPYFISDGGIEYDLTSSLVSYPSAGIVTSTGSDWGTSITDNSSNWNTSYSWGDHSIEGYAVKSESNIFTADQTINKILPSLFLKSSNESSLLRVIQFQNSSGINKGQILSSDDDLYILGITGGSTTIGMPSGSNRLIIDGNGFYAESLDSAITDYAVYYNTSTNELTYGAAPTGGSVGTLDQVLTAGNTSTNTITTGNATILGASPVLNISATGTDAGILNFKENTSTTRASIVAQASGNLDLFPKNGSSIRLYGYSSDNVFKINSTGFYLEGLDAGTTSNIIYWNSTTSELTYGSAQVETQFEKLGANYTFSTTVGGIPATGTIRINNASLSGLTEMDVHETDANSLSRATELYSLALGHWISLRDNNGNWVRFKVNSVIDNGTFATISLSGGLQSNGSIANNAAVVLDFLFLPGTGTGTTYTEGEGINIISGVISCELATSSNKGVASFNLNNFSVVSGDVSLLSGGIYATNFNNNVISGQTELTTGLIASDELLVSDGGLIKRMDVSVLQSYLQNNLLFDEDQAWTTGTNIIYPNNYSTTRVLIGTNIDDGSSKLQVYGSGYFSSTVVANEIYGNDLVYGNILHTHTVLILDETSSVITPNTLFVKSSDHKLYYRDINGVETALT